MKKIKKMSYVFLIVILIYNLFGIYKTSFAETDTRYTEIPYTEERKILKEIEVKKLPNKTSYKLRENIDLTGGILWATYQDNSVEEIPMNSSGITTFGYDLTKGGDQVVTIVYEEKMTTFKIKVENILKNVQVKKLPNKLTYVVGEEIDLTGGVLLALYEDNATLEIPMSSSEVKLYGYDASIKSDQLLTVMYKEKSDVFKVTVKNDITSIEMQNVPNKESYMQGEELDIAEGKIVVSYEDGTNAIIPLEAEGVEIGNYNPNITGEQIVKVKYKGKTTEFKVQVNKINNTSEKNELKDWIIKTGIIMLPIVIGIGLYIRYKTTSF